MINILQTLYDSEINFAIDTFWDEGVFAKIGDDKNGFTDELHGDTVDEVVFLMAMRVVSKYPEYSASKDLKEALSPRINTFHKEQSSVSFKGEEFVNYKIVFWLDKKRFLYEDCYTKEDERDEMFERLKLEFTNE